MLVFSAYLVVLCLVLLYLLVRLWPPTAPPQALRSVPLLPRATLPIKLDAETNYLLIAVLSGALGSYVHLATSFADYVGNRQLLKSWMLWYVLRPFIGTALAVLVYFALRGGLMVGQNATQALSPFGIAAVAGLAGMFSRQAADKMREVFENLFSAKVATARKDPLKE